MIISRPRKEGRTSKMLQRALRAFLRDEPNDVYVLSHSTNYAAQLQAKVLRMMSYTKLPPPVVKEGSITSSDSTMYFRRFIADDVKVGKVGRRTAVFMDHYYPLEIWQEINK